MKSWGLASYSPLFSSPMEDGSNVNGTDPSHSLTYIHTYIHTYVAVPELSSNCFALRIWQCQWLGVRLWFSRSCKCIHICNMCCPRTCLLVVVFSSVCASMIHISINLQWHTRKVICVVTCNLFLENLTGTAAAHRRSSRVWIEREREKGEKKKKEQHFVKKVMITTPVVVVEVGGWVDGKLL